MGGAEARYPLALMLCAAALGSPAKAPAQGVDAAAGSGAIADLAFLAGCWAGRMGSLDMREQWTEAEGGVMLWTTRFFREGRLADFEFGMVVEEDGVPVLWPYPRGERSEHGFPLVSTEGAYVFENLEHDFPVRIVYVRDGADGLTPRIEGRDGEGTGWMLERVACPG
jgi:hypothetical protein